MTKFKHIAALAATLLIATSGAHAGATGDINGDGTINVTDVTALVNKILGTASYSDTTCDTNGDGLVNVTDVTALVNTILGGSHDMRLVGGDISMLPRHEAAGAKYYAESGLVSDMIAYYKSAGWNTMRVRLFVDPSQAPAAHRQEGVVQDLAYVKALGRRIKQAGMQLVLDFHYSDT